MKVACLLFLNRFLKLLLLRSIYSHCLELAGPGHYAAQSLQLYLAGPFIKASPDLMSTFVQGSKSTRVDTPSAERRIKPPPVADRTDTLSPFLIGKFRAWD